MSNFTCEDCSGTCCFNPPQISDEKDFLLAKKHRLKLGAVKALGSYVVSIHKIDNSCPFLVEGNCSIYDDNFLVCKTFTCGLTSHTKPQLGKLGFMEYINLMMQEQETPTPLLFSKDRLHREEIPILTQEEAIDSFLGTPSELLINTYLKDIRNS